MISGPLNNGGSLLTILETNKTHPARIRCQATCLDQQGTSYRPAMALILRSQEHYIPIVPVYGHGARDSFTYSKHGLHFEIRVSYFDVQNNYTMEYEYLITSNASKIDRSVVFCGIKHYNVMYYNDQPYYDQACTCWGQSYGIIHAEVDTLADYQAPANHSSTQAASTSIAINYCEYGGSILPTDISAAAGYGWLVIYTLIPIILVIIIIIITLPLTVGFLYQSRRRHKSKLFAPQCVQTVEQTLVIKVEQPVASESAAVREKETSFSENSDSNRSILLQAQLQEKLPDTISSRSKTL